MAGLYVEGLTGTHKFLPAILKRISFKIFCSFFAGNYPLEVLPGQSWLSLTGMTGRIHRMLISFPGALPYYTYFDTGQRSALPYLLWDRKNIPTNGAIH